MLELRSAFNAKPLVLFRGTEDAREITSDDTVFDILNGRGLHDTHMSTFNDAEAHLAGELLQRVCMIFSFLALANSDIAPRILLRC